MSGLELKMLTEALAAVLYDHRDELEALSGFYLADYTIISNGLLELESSGSRTLVRVDVTRDVTG